MSERKELVPCYVYILYSGDDGPIKVGIARRPEERLIHLQTAHHDELTLAHTIKCRDRETARSVEWHIHKLEYKTHIRGEWFENCSATWLLDEDMIELTGDEMLSRLQSMLRYANT